MQGTTVQARSGLSTQDLNDYGYEFHGPEIGWVKVYRFASRRSHSPLTHDDLVAEIELGRKVAGYAISENGLGAMPIAKVSHAAAKATGGTYDITKWRGVMDARDLARAGSR